MDCIPSAVLELAEAHHCEMHEPSVMERELGMGSLSVVTSGLLKGHWHLYSFPFPELGSLKWTYTCVGTHRKVSEYE